MSEIRRRTMLGGAASAIAAPVLGTVSTAFATSAAAQAWPSRPVRILVGFAAGGTGDTLARVLADKVGPMWNQPVLVENKVGASGTIALDAVAKSAPDGHTLGMLNFAHVVAAELQKLPFSLEQDLVPVAGMAQQGNILVVNPAVPVNTVGELVAYLKQRPGKLSYASGGNGTPGHVAGELFKQQTGTDMVHVAYKGGPPALQDIVAGHVELMFAPAVPALALIKTGKLRPLGVTSTTRSASTPDLPTLSEAGIGFDVRDWHGLVAPRGTPAEVIQRVSSDLHKAFALLDVQAKLAAMGAERLTADAAEFQALVTAETAKWRRVIRQANITAR